MDNNTKIFYGVCIKLTLISILSTALGYVMSCDSWNEDTSYILTCLSNDAVTIADPFLAKHNAVIVLWFCVSFANSLPAKTSHIQTSVPP